jgi:general secretion pathway protein C
VHGALNNHHNGRIMASRIFALIIWAAVAASLAYWGLRWLAPPTGVPAHATPVSLEGGAQGEVRRLLAGPPKAASGANQGAQSAASALVARLRLLGVVAPRQDGAPGGVALLSIDGKPPRAVRVGGVIDGETVLLALTQRGASIGPAGGPAAATLDLPLLPAPSTGSLPPPTGASVSESNGMQPVSAKPPRRLRPPGGMGGQPPDDRGAPSQDAT